MADDRHRRRRIDPIPPEIRRSTMPEVMKPKVRNARPS